MYNRYKESILQMLSESTQPMDVEKIRIACNIGNWQTALKHCLELLHEGKIEGIKSSKSWTFWINPPNPHHNVIKSSNSHNGSG
ncbi:hypothetical protein ACFLQ6_05525 [Thermoproteota archaeon]